MLLGPAAAYFGEKKLGKYALFGVEEKIVNQTEKFLDEVDKIDGRLSLVWNLWKFRMGRIFTPNFVSHIKSIIALCLSVLQLFIILQLVHDTGGHFVNLPHIQIMLFPLYILYGLRLVVQFSTFLFVLYRSLYDEKDHRIHFHFNELNRFLPVVEHLFPVISYIIILLCCLSFGYCHLDEKSADEESEQPNICHFFTVRFINAIVVIVILFHSFHYLMTIYHNKRHTAVPRKKYGQEDQENYPMDEYNHRSPKKASTILSTLENVNEEMTIVFSWWKYRMNRLFSSIVAHKVCDIIDCILEGTQIIVLVNAVSSMHGDVSNIDTSRILVPTCVKLFLKAIIQMIAFGYVCNRAYVKDKLSFLDFLREPSKHNKPLEHLLPVVAYIILGTVTIAIGQCHLGQENESSALCSTFPYEVVIAILITGALIQFAHHILSIYHAKRHSSKPARGHLKEELDNMTTFTGMASSVG
jgi:hypothetical protein